jgi:hypothetical protein
MEGFRPPVSTHERATNRCFYAWYFFSPSHGGGLPWYFLPLSEIIIVLALLLRPREQVAPRPVRAVS